MRGAPAPIESRLLARAGVSTRPRWRSAGSTNEKKAARIAWTIALGLHVQVLAIPGTGDPSHLEQNVAAASLQLSEAELTELAHLD